MGKADWSLETILGIHLGLLDHAHQVSEAAMGALIEIADRKPGAVPVTPVTLLALYMHSFTVASGVSLAVVKCFADLHTAEADEVLKDTLESWHGSNEQFGRWLTILKEAGRADILGQVRREKLSTNQAKMLERAIAG